MIKLIRSWGPVTFAVACSLPGIAAEARPSCSQILDDGPRLACYDAVFGKPVRLAPPAAAPAAVVSSQARVPAPPPEPARPQNQSVSAVVVTVGRLPDERFSITLDNGQSWMQLERDPAISVRVGDSVRIRPAAMGSWMLETREGLRTRVRQAR